ncbi:MAG: hypothetical protein FWE63_06850, partial [Bacteroidales bacterium]|nr:hypothetical protein [Bacteroidales bacterium]
MKIENGELKIMKRLSLLIILMFAMFTAFAQKVVYVRVDGTGNGTSWANASSLEQAMALAILGDEVWVQQGLYYPSATLQVPAGVLMYGGFFGNETILSQRNYAENRTIIDGQKRRVVRLGNGAVLDGFAIINGHAHIDFLGPRGGGVWMEQNARVENCYILDNTASEYGGGIHAVGDGLVYNTLFSGNVAGIDGLAIYGTTLEVRNVTISQNSRLGDLATVDTFHCNIATPAWIIVGTQSFFTDSVWLTDTLLWSDAVSFTTCNKTTFNGGSFSVVEPPVFHSDCRSNPDYKGDLFSWCAVKRFGDELCPAPWRVPDTVDFRTLDIALGGTGSSTTNSILRNKYLDDWGGFYGGRSSATGTLEVQGSSANYWSQAEEDITRARGLNFGTNGNIFPQAANLKYFGFTLRCVYTCPRIILNLTSGENTRTQAVCQNSPIAPVTHSWSGAAANATLMWDVVPAGITGDAASFSGTLTTPGVYKWTITVDHNDNMCPPKISTGSITVHALPTTVVVTGITPACDSAILNASNGNDGTIYWQNTTSNGTDTTTASTSQTVNIDGTYYFRARSNEGCWGEQGSRVVIISTVPTINIHPDTTERNIVEGHGNFSALSVNATSTLSLSYQWYRNTTNSNIGGALISGATSATYTPSNTVGTFYYYCRISNSCGIATSNVSGKHIVEPLPGGCNGNTPGWGASLGTVSFATSQVWVIKSQVWSDAVQATNCSNRNVFNGGVSSNFNADCRSNLGRKGDFFSWCAVARYKDQLCPTPWRVPTIQEFINLDIALGGTGSGQYGETTLALVNIYRSIWGGTYPGQCTETGTLLPSTNAYYQTFTATDADYAYNLFYSSILFGSVFIGSVDPERLVLKNRGFSLRCVRDTTPPPPPAGCNGNIPGWGGSLGTVSFATDSIWVIGTQVWSDAVQATNCSSRTSYNGGSAGNFNADCRSKPDYKGDFFSWCAVVRFQNELCPGNWRVPTMQDFIDL